MSGEGPVTFVEFTSEEKEIFERLIAAELQYNQAQVIIIETEMVKQNIEMARYYNYVTVKRKIAESNVYKAPISSKRDSNEIATDNEITYGLRTFEPYRQHHIRSRRISPQTIVQEQEERIPRIRPRRQETSVEPIEVETKELDASESVITTAEPKPRRCTFQ